MSVVERAKAWIAGDPDPAARKELDAIVARAEAGDSTAANDLSERMAGPLSFGTAGLRGVLGAGESRMNRAVVRRTTSGLATYLLRMLPDAKTRGVVVGYDGRRMSPELAADTAGVLAANGIIAHLSPWPCPTPVAAYAITRLGAAAGVIITASHNPPEYNGYKAYWENGAQIIPPHDIGIAAAIDAAPCANDIPVMDIDEARRAGLVKSFPDDLERAYLDAVRGLGIRAGGDRSLRIVYTALHGVGDRWVRAALTDAGFTRLHSVAEQAEPDGEFPTVAFPNPEEPGALDLSYALAEREHAELIIANDPDVDRLAVAVKNPAGGWTQLTGNQIGVLLGHYLLTESRAVSSSADSSSAGASSAAAADRRLVIVSCVSSPMLGAIARSLGVRYEETLTGFKWIANRAMELAATDGLDFVFGYEEALGYTVGTLVRDKDGIGAAAVLCELAAIRRAAGKTLLDELDDLARRYGLYVSRQVSVTLKGQGGLEQMRAVMTSLRRQAPAVVGALAVEAITDVQAGTRTPRGGAAEPISLPASDVLVFELEGGNRITVRPSGTEPKIKFYFDLVEPLREGEATSEAAGRANLRLDALASAFRAMTGV